MGDVATLVDVAIITQKYPLAEKGWGYPAATPDPKMRLQRVPPASPRPRSADGRRPHVARGRGGSEREKETARDNGAIKAKAGHRGGMCRLELSDWSR